VAGAEQEPDYRFTLANERTSSCSPWSSSRTHKGP
jgi:hypothetical protein